MDLGPISGLSISVQAVQVVQGVFQFKTERQGCEGQSREEE